MTLKVTGNLEIVVAETTAVPRNYATDQSIVR
jgi:hypothetical protein